MHNNGGSAGIGLFQRADGVGERVQIRERGAVRAHRDFENARRVLQAPNLRRDSSSFERAQIKLQRDRPCYLHL